MMIYLFVMDQLSLEIQLFIVGSVKIMGTQTLAEVLKNSCNVGMMEIGQRLGIEKLNKYSIN